jgi:hypothetical protein
MRMDESKKAEESRIQMPGVLSLQATLAPSETQTQRLQIPADYDFLLHRVTCQSDGPVLLTFEITPGAKSPGSTAQIDQAFTDALQTEYPSHLAALAGESLADWTRRNATLGQRAAAGDDEAFFDLIARDPRVVGSTLTVAKIVSWRTELEGYAKYLKLKGSKLFPLTGPEEARLRMEAAKKNLRRLGETHIAFHDQRGKNPLPPPGVVKGLYYAFLFLVAGLKREFQTRASRDGEDKARRDLLAMVAALKNLQVQPDSFFIYIAWAVGLLDQLRIGEVPGLSQDNLLTLVGPRSSKPSELALDLTGQVFEISKNTVETLKEIDDVIAWTGPHGKMYAVGGRPNFDLAGFPEFQQVTRSLTP